MLHQDTLTVNVIIHHSKDWDGRISGLMCYAEVLERDPGSSVELIGYDYADDLQPVVDRVDALREFYPHRRMTVTMTDVSFPTIHTFERWLNQGIIVHHYDHHVARNVEHRDEANRLLKPYLQSEQLKLYYTDLPGQSAISIVPRPTAWGKAEKYFLDLLADYDTFHHVGMDNEDDATALQLGLDDLYLSKNPLEYTLPLEACAKGNSVNLLAYFRKAHQRGFLLLSQELRGFEEAYQKGPRLYTDGIVPYATVLHADQFPGLSISRYSLFVNRRCPSMPMVVSVTPQAGGKTSYSIRSQGSHIDCAVFAKLAGGGGHPKAAGFTTSSDVPYQETLLGLWEEYHNMKHHAS